MKRALSRCLGWGLSLGVLVPMLVRAGDNFPFSNYPMFTADRSRVDLTVMLHSDSVATLLQGERVPPAWIAGEEVMMAMTTIMRATWGGVPGMTRLCEEVILQADKQGHKPKSIAFVVESIDVLATVRGDEVPNTRKVLFVCPSQKVQR